MARTNCRGFHSPALIGPAAELPPSLMPVKRGANNHRPRVFTLRRFTDLRHKVVATHRHGSLVNPMA